MEYGKHLYMIMHPNHSLIASQLEPEDFIKHYVEGSARYFEGRLVFVEIDPDFRSPYFDIDGAYAQLLPHEDGRPKATKFIMSYRVLENIDFDALGTLYVCNSSGDYVALESADYDSKTRGDEMRIILEINPVKFIVLTKYNFLDFSAYITDPHNAKGAPKMLYTQLEFSVDDFMRTKPGEDGREVARGYLRVEPGELAPHRVPELGRVEIAEGVAREITDVAL